MRIQPMTKDVPPSVRVELEVISSWLTDFNISPQIVKIPTIRKILNNPLAIDVNVEITFANLRKDMETLHKVITASCGSTYFIQNFLKSEEVVENWIVRQVAMYKQKKMLKTCIDNLSVLGYSSIQFQALDMEIRDYIRTINENNSF